MAGRNHKIVKYERQSFNELRSHIIQKLLSYSDGDSWRPPVCQGSEVPLATPIQTILSNILKFFLQIFCTAV